MRTAIIMYLGQILTAKTATTRVPFPSPPPPLIPYKPICPNRPQQVTGSSRSKMANIQHINPSCYVVRLSLKEPGHVRASPYAFSSSFNCPPQLLGWSIRRWSTVDHNPQVVLQRGCWNAFTTAAQAE